MKLNQIVRVVRDIVIAYGGWCTGGYLDSKLHNDYAPRWQSGFIGMITVQLLARYVDQQIKEEKSDISPKVRADFPYRSDHADRYKAEANKTSPLIR